MGSDVRVEAGVMCSKERFNLAMINTTFSVCTII